MKALKSFLLIASVGVLFTFSNCGGGGSTPEPVADQQLAKLSKTWKLNTVTLGTADKKASYPSFVLTISGTKGQTSFGYKTTGNPTVKSVWKGNGSWSFGADPKTMLIRDPSITTDKLEMSYVVSETTLQIIFTFPDTLPGYDNQGRAEVVTGIWTFTFGL